MGSSHSRLEIEGNTTSPWLHRIWMLHRELQRAIPDPWGCFPEGPWRLPGCRAALLWLQRLRHVFVLLLSKALLPASPGAVLATHLEQIFCLQAVSGTAAHSWRGLSPPIPACLYRPLGESWDLLFTAKGRKDLLTG